ncbi:MAG TPA: hypothetical protein PLI51_08085 [bacterium]|nr:hypothetical protein [bacterium]HPQ66668.1 hypothetical protein [bacterium]
MARETGYFPLSLEELRAVGGWAADCAERALAVLLRMPSRAAGRSRLEALLYELDAGLRARGMD